MTVHESRPIWHRHRVDIRLADGQEVGTKITDEPSELYLEESIGEGFKETESGVQEVLDGSVADLEERDEEDGRGTKKATRAAA